MHDISEDQPPLTWRERARIARQIARNMASVARLFGGEAISYARSVRARRAR